MSETVLWYEKYRPRTLDAYVWMDDDTKGMVTDWIARGTVPSLLLTGGPGRGKTALATLLIDALMIDDGDVLYINGPSDNNVETVRTKIQEFCELGGWSGLRVIVINEADVLTHAAQQLLRNMMDEYASSVRWILTCNYPHRIIEPISSSRLVRIEIDKLDLDSFTAKMCEILLAEDVELDDGNFNVVEKIRDACYPDLRKAINVMQHSIRDGKLRAMREVQSAAGVWETYINELFSKQPDPVREIGRMRDILKMLAPDEMEEVYRYLYHNGTKLFGRKEINAIIIINNGQKAHKLALLPDMILLEVLLRLVTLMVKTD